jgi:hypothetical protein
VVDKVRMTTEIVASVRMAQRHSAHRVMVAILDD